VKLKISKDTDKLIKHIFNFHLNMRQMQPNGIRLHCHDPLDRTTFGSHGISISEHFLGCW
jgi:hypothetical protein